MNEADFIAALRNFPLHPGARGLNDDCAVIEVGGETLILTYDSMAEGTHWLPGQDMADVAWKLVASNLSDLASKGAEPVGVLLGHTLDGDEDRFLAGLQEVLNEYSVPLLGGDTICAKGPRTLGLTAIGRATHTPVPARSGAKVGDGVFVCGVIGDAMAGFHELTKANRARELGLEPEDADKASPYFAAKFLRPTPLIKEGQALARHVNAMMDVSDGLFLDASRMAKTSEVTFSLELDAVPHSSKFKDYASDGNQLDKSTKGWPCRLAACSWGDDYALLFTAPAKAQLPIECAKIGEVLAQTEHPLLVDGKAIASDELGYQHG